MSARVPRLGIGILVMVASALLTFAEEGRAKNRRVEIAKRKA